MPRVAETKSDICIPIAAIRSATENKSAARPSFVFNVQGQIDKTTSATLMHFLIVNYLRHIHAASFGYNIQQILNNTLCYVSARC